MPNKRKCRHKPCGKRDYEDTMLTVPLGAFCNFDCANAYTNDKQVKQRSDAKLAKHKRAELMEKKTAIKRSNPSQLTQSDFSKVQLSYVNPKIRERDKGLPCISCGAPWSDSFQAGHYIAIGSQWRRSWLRYHPYVIAGQCQNCNLRKSGNGEGYALGIIKRHGTERLELIAELKALAHKSPPLTYDDLQAIKKGDYKFPFVENK